MEAHARDESGTATWYAFQVDEVTFGIYDTFSNHENRETHIHGEIVKSLRRKRREPHRNDAEDQRRHREAVLRLPLRLAGLLRAPRSLCPAPLTGLLQAPRPLRHAPLARLLWDRLALLGRPLAVGRWRPARCSGSSRWGGAS